MYCTIKWMGPCINVCGLEYLEFATIYYTGIEKLARSCI